jgi:uncharacterized repeat protein (TIGR03803 family)
MERRARLVLSFLVASAALCARAAQPADAAAVALPYAEQVVYSFTGKGDDGLHPDAGLVADGTGKLYGTTGNGGPHYAGTVFVLVPSGTGFAERTIYRFQGGSDGAGPFASIIVDTSGALYGTTYAGGGLCGGSGCGIAFKLTPGPSGYSETVMHRFGAAGDGGTPLSALLAGRSREFYGTTISGGAFGYGVVYRLRPTATGYSEDVLYSFRRGSDGASPVGALILDASGTLYGTTVAGGSAGCSGEGCGTVFKLTPAGGGYVESVLYRFGIARNDGSQPESSLLADGSGNLFGTTVSGGYCYMDPHGCGTVFELTKRGSRYSEDILHRFRGRSDGRYPFGNLIANASGTLFGATAKGGGGRSGCDSFDCGTVYELRPSGRRYVERTDFAFRRLGEGDNPVGGLVLGPSGALFGTTWQGGAFNSGVVYEVSPP